MEVLLLASFYVMVQVNQGGTMTKQKNLANLGSFLAVHFIFYPPLGLA